MAGGARAAAAAKREQFVKACVADHLHHREAVSRLDRRFLTFARYHVQLCHVHTSRHLYLQMFLCNGDRRIVGSETRGSGRGDLCGGSSINKKKKKKKQKT